MAKMAALKARDRSYRFLVLFFTCMLTFGSYFCFDMPSVLQDVFTETNNCTKNISGTMDIISNKSTNYTCNNCTDCLGMSDADYNLLYAIYAWTNAAVVIGAGFLVDKLGNRVGVYLFSFMCLVGSSIFAAGAFLEDTSALLPVMLVGRLVFGAGNGALTIVQNTITAYWFKDKELALAFGVTLAFSRLGSVLNFVLTQSFESTYGLEWTLWAGAMLCGVGFVSAIAVGILDKHGVQQLGQEADIKIEAEKVRITDIRQLSLSFWLITLAIMFFYNGVFPFVADASKFIQEKYGLESDVSSYLAGAVYDVSLVLSPFLGGIIDIIGKRGILAMLTAILTIPVFGLLAFTDVYPLVSTLWLGVTYSVAAASMWPSIPLVVSQATLGTAMGLATSIQMLGIGIANLIVGQILGDSDEELQGKKADEEQVERWKFVMIFLLVNILCCIVATAFLNMVDRRKGGILNHSRKQKLLLEEGNEKVEKSELSDAEEEPLLSVGPEVKRLRDGNALAYSSTAT